LVLILIKFHHPLLTSVNEMQSAIQHRTRLHLKNGVCVVFDEQVLPYLKIKDQEVLRVASCADDTSRYINELSPQLKDCLLAIGGAKSADLLGVDPRSCSMPYLDLNHFEDKIVEFSVLHISELPKWTTGKTRGKGSGDRIVVDCLLGPPYLQGDHKAVDPKGALDFALSAVLRDAVWVDAAIAIVSPKYRWDKLYMAERGSALVYKQVLNGTRLFGMGDDARTYGETNTVYKASASAPFRALKEISELHHNNSLAIGGPNHTLLRPGMGVVIDPPLLECPKGAALEVMHGTITAVDQVSKTMTFRALLGRANMPEYVLGNLGANEVVQTNVICNVPFHWVVGTFRLLPPQLFNAECIPRASENQMANKFLSRIVVCDMQIFPNNETRFSGFEDEIMVSFEIFAKLLQGQLRLTLSRLKPFPARAALAYLHRQNELEGGLFPPALAYRCTLGYALTTFARQKAAHAKSAKDQLSFRPDVPGRALMALLYRTMNPDDTNIAIRNGDLMVEIKNVDALSAVFGLSPSKFDFRGEGLGVVEFDGPFIFKWSMYDTLEPWGPLSGSVSISVGSFTEYNRMGTDVIKSSKRHPDAALRGSGIKGFKAPVEKKARTTKASSDNGRTKQASQTLAQAEARRQRQSSRTALLAGGSGSESTSTSDEHDGSRPFGQPQAQYYSDSLSGGEGPPSADSDSQSSGEGPAAAYSPLAADRSNSQSMRGGFVDSDHLLEPVGRMGEKLLNAVAAEQGERRRWEGQAAPA
jgi:hypothetical protein